MSDFQTNPWIQFLRKYGPVQNNDNMYDETIQRALRRSGSAPLEFEAPFVDELVKNFRSESPQSVILTGTAGDGKTFVCRKVWEEIGGDPSVWQQDDSVRQLDLPFERTLVVIKDLSELRDESEDHLTKMADAVLGRDASYVFLIAANDGQLVEAWNRVPDSQSVLKVRQLIEDLLVTDKKTRDHFQLLLYNLSRTSAAEMFRKIVTAIVDHSGWEGCSSCRGQEAGIENRCPIWENYSRLQENLFQERLRDLLELCDHNEYHLPIRQLLVLITNTLLGHQDAGKDRLLRCRDVPQVVSKETASLASPYSNVFGENLTERRMESIEAFEVLNRFGIGSETTNRIDNTLIYGADDTLVTKTFDALVREDEVYGATARYLALQRAYLEESLDETTEDFLYALRRQRQRLFFTMPSEHARTLRLWDLSVFKFGGEYLHDVISALSAGRPAPRRILSRLVCGLNRVFTGMNTTTDRQIVLATAGSFSQARVSHIEEARIEVEPTRGQRVTLEMMSNRRLVLAVQLERDFRLDFTLHLVRFEFLSRVAEGALPSSFSRECYEDCLAFKSRLLSEHRRATQENDNAEPAQTELRLKLLELDTRGLIQMRPLEVRA